MMIKKILMVSVIMLHMAGAPSAHAQLRLDINLSTPLCGFANTTFIPWILVLPLVPDLNVRYQFGERLIDWGVGVRTFSLLLSSYNTYILSITYPEVFVEFNMGKVTFDLDVGGFLFLFTSFWYGLLPVLDPIIVSDLNVTYKVGDRFRVGGGVLLLGKIPGSSGMNPSGFFMGAVYINAGFVIKLL